jgi:hypothetical protein
MDTRKWQAAVARWLRGKTNAERGGAIYGWDWWAGWYMVSRFAWPWLVAPLGGLAIGAVFRVDPTYFVTAMMVIGLVYDVVMYRLAVKLCG